MDGIRDFSEGVVSAASVGRDLVAVVWENREAAAALGAVWASFKIGAIVADTVAAAAAKAELAQASRLASVQAAAEARARDSGAWAALVELVRLSEGSAAAR